MQILAMAKHIILPPQQIDKQIIENNTYLMTRMNINTEIRKAKAPSPPSAKAANSTSTPTNEKFYLQLTQEDKLFTDESSYC